VLLFLAFISFLEALNYFSTTIVNYLPFTRPTIDEDTIQRVVETLRSGWLASGPRVQELENALSGYLNARPVRTFTSATGALEVALQVCGVGPGDEVILPALSFVATANVIMRVGAKPVFVDVELENRNIDLKKAEAAITSRTRAIMPVHFAGLPVDMDALYKLARKHNLRVVEDAAHAIGSAWQGKKIGSFGDLVVFSFHPNKNMTTIEGGAVSINDVSEIKKFELHRWHGISKSDEETIDVTFAGGKYNLSDVAAQVGIGQLKRLDEFNAKRRQLVARYFECFAEDARWQLPPKSDDGHSWHMFNPLLPLKEIKLTRLEFIRTMHQHGIGVGVHYPAMHLFSAYRKLGYNAGDFPIAERIGREIITLPLFPAMAIEDVERVYRTISEILKK
jgi:dTDP-4-amino-4,6-dideoxygalactose transaminase